MYCKWGFFDCGGQRWWDEGWKKKDAMLPVSDEWWWWHCSSLWDPMGGVENLEVIDPTINSLKVRWVPAPGNVRSYKVFYTAEPGGVERMVGNLLSLTLIYPDCFNVHTLQPWNVSLQGCCQWTHCHADYGFNILLNRRRCQEAPPPPPWGTWILTLSTMWLLFPFIQTWRAYGRPRRERQVSDSRGRIRIAVNRACVPGPMWVCFLRESQISNAMSSCLGFSLGDGNKAGILPRVNKSLNYVIFTYVVDPDSFCLSFMDSVHWKTTVATIVKDCFVLGL